MKIVLDTNVFISGVFFSGPPYQILKAWRDGYLQLLISEEILFEYQRVGELLSKEFPQVDFGPFIELLTINKELFTPLFAVARIAGWCSHRIEQLMSDKKIIRPAYQNVSVLKEYIPINMR